MTHPAADAARSAATIMAADLGSDLPAAVEAILQASDDHTQSPDQYDPLAIVGLGVGAASLIVSLAQLAWSVYTSQREYTPEPASESIAREIRIILSEQPVPTIAETDRIAEVIITEIIRHADESG